MKFTKVIKAEQFNKEIILSNISRKIFQDIDSKITKYLTENNLELNLDNIDYILNDIKLMFNNSEIYK